MALGRRGTGAAAPLGCGTPPREPLPFGPPDPTVRWSAAPGRTATTVRRAGDGYSYEVGGQPETVRGMGYNPPAADPTTRRQRLERDLSLMAAAGVNTLIGWNPGVVDGMALDVSQQAGLGVALPFDVDYTLDVTDDSVRRSFVSAVLAWVDQYRDHPALRMWAVGNEVLQRSVPPAWCSTPPSESQAAWAAAWARLLVELADQIHGRDPDHPVLYREAEDAYAPWLSRALAAQPADRPWLIYGVNAYTPRLAEILDTWHDRAVPTPLLVSEYAPLNAPRGARAGRFREIWDVIRARQTHVIGGAAYVWSTDGPEEVDRAFGMVDASGEPVDDALDTIAAFYHDDTQRETILQNGVRTDDLWTARRALAAASGGRPRAGRGRDDG
jgi:hypothetical protein